MKENIFIDNDGVIYNLSKLGQPSILTAALNTVKKLNLGKDAEEILINASKVLKDDQMYKPFWDLVDCKEYEVDVFNQEIVKASCYKNIPSNPKLLQILQKLQKKYNVTIITDNTIHHVNEVFMAVFGCNVLQSELSVYSIENAKTQKYCLTKSNGGLELFCKKRNINPKDCLLIDDSEANINAAHNIEMSYLLFNEKMNINDILQII